MDYLIRQYALFGYCSLLKPTFLIYGQQIQALAVQAPRSAERLEAVEFLLDD